MISVALVLLILYLCFITSFFAKEALGGSVLCRTEQGPARPRHAHEAQGLSSGPQPQQAQPERGLGDHGEDSAAAETPERWGPVWFWRGHACSRALRPVPLSLSVLVQWQDLLPRRHVAPCFGEGPGMHPLHLHRRPPRLQTHLLPHPVPLPVSFEISREVLQDVSRWPGGTHHDARGRERRRYDSSWFFCL